MPNLNEIITSQNVVSYWETVNAGNAPFLGATLFPNEPQQGLEFRWLKGKTGVPKALRPSAFDADVIPRGREGFEELVQEMAFFKESFYIDERTRQELLMVMQTKNQTYIDTVINRVFGDTAELIDASESRKEIMRMQALTTGSIALKVENGNKVQADYEIPVDQNIEVKTSWDNPDAPVLDDIETALGTLASKGIIPTRILLNSVTVNKIRKNVGIKANLISGDVTNKRISKQDVLDYLRDEFKLQVAVYDKVYNDGDKNGVKKFVPDGTIVFLPEGNLGKTYIGTTPEEADLMYGTKSDVKIVNGGTAVTTMTKEDPVSVETKVSMVTFPSFEQSDKIYILKTLPTTGV